MKLKPKTLTITVPKPCHENWQDMSPEAQGRHCSSCSKLVYDFTSMSDAQLIQFLADKKGNACGRFRKDQLNQPLALPMVERLWSFPRFIAASALTFFAAIGSSLAAPKATFYSPLEQTETVHGGIRLEGMKFKTISGIVLLNDKPFEGVEIRFAATGLDSIFTDSLGNFKIVIPEETALMDEHLTFIHVDAMPYSISLSNAHEGLLITLSPITCIKMETHVTMGVPMMLGEPELRVLDAPAIEQGQEKVFDSKSK
jgi:hypothetical protein